MAAPLWKHWNSDLSENFVKIHDETGKKAESRLFTVQQVMQTLADSDSDGAEFDQDYCLSSITDTESEQSSASDNEDRPRSSVSGSTISRSRSTRGTGIVNS